MNNENQPENNLRDWSSLPGNIIFHFLNCLNNTITDCRRLRSVCTSWRSSLSPPTPPLGFPLQLSKFPFIKLGKAPYFVTGDVRIGALEESVFYLISSPSHESNNVWLTRVSEWGARWSLQNPISLDVFFRPLPKINAKVNFLDYGISEVARSYGFTSYFAGNEYLVSKKAVMLPSPNPSLVATSVFSILSLSCDGLLSFIKYDNSDEQNNNIYKFSLIGSVPPYIADIIAYKGSFYALYLTRKLLKIDPITFDKKVIVDGIFPDGTYEFKFDELLAYLVESCGKLYLVYKVTKSCNNENDYGDAEWGAPVKFRVFSLETMCTENGQEKQFWQPAVNLGDRVFFVSQYITFSLASRELGWDQGNCVVFTQEGFMKHICFDDGEDCDYIEYHTYTSEQQLFSKYCGLYNLDDDTIVLNSSALKLFWPIPTWLANN